MITSTPTYLTWRFFQALVDLNIAEYGLLEPFFDSVDFCRRYGDHP